MKVKSLVIPPLTEKTVPPVSAVARLTAVAINRVPAKKTNPSPPRKAKTIMTISESLSRGIADSPTEATLLFYHWERVQVTRSRSPGSNPRHKRSSLKWLPGTEPQAVASGISEAIFSPEVVRPSFTLNLRREPARYRSRFCTVGQRKGAAFFKTAPVGVRVTMP